MNTLYYYNHGTADVEIEAVDVVKHGSVDYKKQAETLLVLLYYRIPQGTFNEFVKLLGIDDKKLITVCEKANFDLR